MEDLAVMRWRRHPDALVNDLTPTCIYNVQSGRGGRGGRERERGGRGEGRKIREGRKMRKRSGWRGGRGGREGFFREMTLQGNDTFLQ